jgi:outer membrane protein OmpU
MKKQLLITTALVTAGAFALSGAALAAKPKLSLGGHAEQIFGVGNNANDFDALNGQRTGFDVHSDSEVHFNGSVTLDNGIKIRTRVELEGNSADQTAGRNSNVINGAPGTAANGAGAGSVDFIDEHWMRISGSFGEVRLGSGDAAAQAMTTGYLGTWSTGVGQLMAFDTTDWISNTQTGSTVGRVDLSSDAEQISYYTPRFSGFQAGLSYIPSDNEDVNNQRALNAAGDRDGWSMGVNYVTKMNGVGIGIAAGYATEDETTVNRTDREVWGVGARIDFSGFRIGVSWVDREEQHSSVTNVTNAGGQGQEHFEIGARYTFGPNAVSIAHMDMDTQASQASGRNGDEAIVTAVAYRRTLGPGVAWKVTATRAEFNDGATGALANASNDGEAITSSISLRF